MNIWHDIDPAKIEPENFTAVIEISKGSNMKYELDKNTGLLRLDRILYTATYYPENYGFIPLTYGDDLDPLDVLVICSQPIAPLTLVQCYPIGVIKMIDNGRNDEKIIAIPFADPSFADIHSVRGLPEHLFNQLEHFFTVYKQLENKETVVDTVHGKEVALRLIKEAIERYKQYFKDGKPV